MSLIFIQKYPDIFKGPLQKRSKDSSGLSETSPPNEMATYIICSYPLDQQIEKCFLI